MSNDTQIFKPEPWEKQDGETEAMFIAFVHYRDMSPAKRSVRAAYNSWRGNEVGPRINYNGKFGRWAREWKWEARACAKDRHDERVGRIAREEQIKRMAERHVALAEGMQKKIYERLKTMKPSRLTASNVAQWLEVSAKLERLSLGAHTEKTQVDAKIEVDNPYSELTDEEFEELETLAARIRSRKDSGGSGSAAT